MNKTKLFVTTAGTDEDKLVQLGASDPVKAIADAAKSAGLPVPEAALFFLEEREEPLDPDKGLQDVGVRADARIHIGRCKKVGVAVHYGKDEVQKSFPPSVLVGTVHAWAAGKLLPNEVDRKEHVLQLCESNVQPTPRTQIGTLVKGEGCELCFDLVASERVEG
jgi:hypothetical protein